MPTFTSNADVWEPSFTTSNSTTSNSTTNDTIWVAWASTTATQTSWVVDCRYTGATPNLTLTAAWTTWAHQVHDIQITREEREAREQQWLEDQRRRARERDEADDKAEALLRENLSEEQGEELTKLGFFHLYVGNKKYRIKRGYAGNIELIDDGVPVRKFCIHTRERVPNADNMLAQKLLLESNEGEFLRVANASEVHRYG